MRHRTDDSATTAALSVRDEISHEIRTPLTLVKTSLQLLKRRWGRLDDDERRAALDEALAHVEKVQDALTHLEERASFLVETPLERKEIDLTPPDS